jgi:hypothetical protein
MAAVIEDALFDQQARGGGGFQGAGVVGLLSKRARPRSLTDAHSNLPSCRAMPDLRPFQHELQSLESGSQACGSRLRLTCHAGKLISAQAIGTRFRRVLMASRISL